MLDDVRLTLDDHDPRVAAAEAAERQLYDFYGISYAVRQIVLPRYGIKVRITETGEVKAERTDIPFFADPVLKKHFELQHLTADAVGKLAAGAGVRSVVTTHNPLPESLIPQARVTIASHYDGPVAFAKDLGNY